MATHSSVLAWRMLWSEEPGGLHSTGLQRVRHNGVNNTFMLFFPTKLLTSLCWQLFQHHFNNSQKHQLGVQHCVQVWRLLPRVNTVSMGGGLTPQDWPHYRWHWHIGPLEPHHSRYDLLELLTEQEFDCESKHLGMTRSKLCLVVWGQLRYMARSGVTQKQQVSTPCRTSCPKHHGILIKCRLFWH